MFSNVWFIFFKSMQMHNPSKGFTSLFCFFSFMLISIGLTTGSICSDTAGNFTTNSTYDQNRNLVLSSFASKVVLNDGFFYTTSIGQEPDKVYGLALCRRDSSSEQCTRCITTAIASIMDNCPNKKEAIAWGGDPQCIIRYANRNIFGKMETDPMAGCGNKNSITANMTQFNQTWERLMDGLARKASSESYDSSRKFATGEASLTYLVKIYALMQCTPDISESYCDYCLRQSLRYCEDQFAGKPGGCLVMRPSCMYLWGLSPFYEAFPADSTSPSPPQSNNFTKIIKGKGGIASETLKIIFVSVVIFLALAALVHVLLQRRKTKSTMIKEEIKKDQGTEDDDEILPAESLQFDFNTIKTATNNFSIDNKLGQGGFGVVYKGRLPDGQDIAVKRLSRNFGQGETEFKNEVLLVARLQHRNLVRLIGFCLEGNERLLIYEFVVNSSLDSFIFDSIKCLLLNWETRLKIIEGIARGLMYLHEDSRLRIIHRDLKASNILLDVNMIPKISDFGMARLFETDQSQATTNRIVGTLGYMAPEYVKHGHFSVKSDVFSFGVLVLEIISGQKNTSFPHKEEAQDLLTYAWRNWKEGKTSNLIDPILRVGYNSSEMMRCIHIGLLCVQENVANRPTMASVVLMLTSFSLSLPLPSKPAFYINSNTTLIHSEVRMVDQYKNHVHFSLNEASISQLEPR